MFRQVHKALKPDEKKVNPWDDANMLQNVKNEGVHVTTVANQRYVYRACLSPVPTCFESDSDSGHDCALQVESLRSQCTDHGVITSLSGLLLLFSFAIDSDAYITHDDEE